MTNRLCKRMGFIEKLLPDTIPLTEEQFMRFPSSAFTMDIYAAVSDTMRKQSQDRMEQLFKDVSEL